MCSLGTFLCQSLFILVSMVVYSNSKLLLVATGINKSPKSIWCGICCALTHQTALSNRFNGSIIIAGLFPLSREEEAPSGQIHM